MGINNNVENDLDKTIEKIFRKYTLEVDDAIEAHGFKATSYIDYAEDTISELENDMKKKVAEYGRGILFTNLEETLNETVKNIVDNTKKTAYERREIYSGARIEQKSEQLHTLLTKLNNRFINSIEQL